MVPPPHEVIPKAIATDAAKAIENRPILLNVMRFLNPREWPGCATSLLRAILWGYKS
jgi:hypothetical protein